MHVGIDVHISPLDHFLGIHSFRTQSFSYLHLCIVQVALSGPSTGEQITVHIGKKNEVKPTLLLCNSS